MMDNVPDNKNDAAPGQQPNQDVKDGQQAGLNLGEQAILSQQALRKGEDRYRVLFDNIDQGVLLCELVRNEKREVTGLRFIEVNPAWRRMANISSEAVKDKSVHGSWPGLDQPWTRYCEQVKESGAATRFETRMGDNQWLDVFITQVEDDRFMILLTDITEQKRHNINQSFLAHCSASLLGASSLTDMLDAIAENAHTFLDASVCAFLRVEDDQDTLSWVAGSKDINQGLKENGRQLSHWVNAREKEQLLQATPLILGRKNHEPALGAMCAALYVPVVREHQMQYLLCIYHSYPYQWFDDQVAILTELAGSVWNKLARMEAEEKLKVSEENYKAIVNQSISGIFKLKLDGSIWFTNEHFARMLDYSVEDLLRFAIKDIVHPEDLDRTFTGFNNMLQTGQPFALDKRLRRKDQSIIWVTNCVAPLFDRQRQIIGAVVVSVDVSRQKAVELQKDEFISIASHELKTPLTSVKAYGQLVQQTAKDGNTRELADMIVRMNLHIDRLVNLVSTILDTTKLEKQAYSINLEKLDINELIEEKVRENQLVAPHFKFVFKRCERIWIHGDKISLGQVLNNLIANAIKYSPYGSTIIIECASTGTEVKVSITDEGIGISQKDQEKIFEKYYRSEGLLESGRSGIGLGLYLCGEIIRRHQGEIGVSSELGVGPSLYFAIPSINLNLL